MVTLLKQTVSLAEFETFIDLPENVDKNFEFIGGEIFEVSSNSLASKAAMAIGGEIYAYLREHDIGHLTGPDGGYMINGERYIPDVAFISYDRQAEMTATGYNPNPPELAVEIISNPDNKDELVNLRRKIVSYLNAGVILVWVVNPHERYIEVYETGKPLRILGENDMLDGGTVLEGFQLPVKRIFPKVNAVES